MGVVRVNSPDEPFVFTKSASYTLVASDVNCTIRMDSGSATSIIVNSGVFQAGQAVRIENVGAGVCTVTGGSASVSGVVSFENGHSGTLYFPSTSEVVCFLEGDTPGVVVDFVVVAGGGGGTGKGGTTIPAGGGGGAGGYRSSCSNELSGGGAYAEPSLVLTKNEAYPIVVGAGGAAAALAFDLSAHGNFSQLAWIVSYGGGPGAMEDTAGTDLGGPNFASFGGSGGGGAGQGSNYVYGGLGIRGQGFDGGSCPELEFGPAGAGGGGAGAPGGSPYNNRSDVYGGFGGNGVVSTITGTPVYRAGGGGGAGDDGFGPGGRGGGGDGFQTIAGQDGAANTGGGGGGGGNDATTLVSYAGNGGSGVVIFRVPDTTTVTFSAGVTSSTSTIGAYKVVTVTATSTLSETVTLS